MEKIPDLGWHRVESSRGSSVVDGSVRLAPAKAAWLLAMAGGAFYGLAIATWDAVLLFVFSTAMVLLFGHSLGSHRKLIHDSYQCPRWLEYLFVYLGALVGLAGPLGLLRQHELRDYAQRLPHCHAYLRHGSGFWKDAYWQLACELRLSRPPNVRIEPGIANDRFYRFIEATWMLQQLPWAIVFYLLGGWAYVCWGVCARVTAGVVGHWLIGYFAHNKGGMHHVVDGAAVQGRNIPFTSLLTMGESWHNNHHAFPGSARLGLYAGEWDPGWWALMLLRRAGLVRSVQVPRHLPFRPELRALAPHADSFNAPVTDVLVAPSSPLSRTQLQWIVGPNVMIRVDPTEQRLRWLGGASCARGLPALLTAMARRGKGFAAIAALAMPFAFRFESLRTSLDIN